MTLQCFYPLKRIAWADIFSNFSVGPIFDTKSRDHNVSFEIRKYYFSGNSALSIGSKTGRFCPKFKVGWVLPMVISSDFRTAQHRDDDHEEDVPHFSGTPLNWPIGSFLAHVKKKLAISEVKIFQYYIFVIFSENWRFLFSLWWEIISVFTDLSSFSKNLNFWTFFRKLRHAEALFETCSSSSLSW